MWDIYLDWAFSLNSVRTAKSIIRRYLKINSNFKEKFVDYLIQKGEFNDAALYYKEVNTPQITYKKIKILDDEQYYSESGKSSY